MPQTVRFVQIALHDDVIGEIEVRGGLNRFFFYDSYLEDPARNVLGLRFEEDLRGQWTGQSALPSWFGNLLPEGSLHRLVDEELRRALGRDPTDADLLSRLGSDLPGAVTAVEVPESGVRRRYPVVVRDLRAASSRRESGELRFSLAGVGMKFSLLRDADKFVAPATGVLGDWLVKLPDPLFAQLPGNEYATMKFAAEIGLNVPEILFAHRDEFTSVPDWLWHGEDRAFAIRRFDRPIQGGKTHIEDLAQVRGYAVGDRYRGTFETAAALIWRQAHDEDLIEFVQRLAFNFLIGNDDAHLKNWSMIYRDGRTARLSPAYDLVSVEAYGAVGLDRGIGLRLANSRRYRDVTLASFSRLGRLVGYASHDLGDVARDVVLRVKDAWVGYMDAIPPSLDRDRIADHYQRMLVQLGG